MGLTFLPLRPNPLRSALGVLEIKVRHNHRRPTGAQLLDRRRPDAGATTRHNDRLAIKPQVEKAEAGPTLPLDSHWIHVPWHHLRGCQRHALDGLLLGS